MSASSETYVEPHPHPTPGLIIDRDRKGPRTPILPPLTDAGRDFAVRINGCAAMKDLDPGDYHVRVDHNGDVVLTWDLDPHRVLRDRKRDVHRARADTALAINLRGLLTAVKHGLIR